MRAFDISFYFEEIVGFEHVLQLYTWWDSENHFRTYLIMTMAVASSQRRYISDSANEMRVTKCGENCQTLNSLWQPELTSGASASLSPSNFARTKRNWCALNPSTTLPGTETKRTVNYRAPLFSRPRGKRVLATNKFATTEKLSPHSRRETIVSALTNIPSWKPFRPRRHYELIFDKSAHSAQRYNRVSFRTKKMNNIINVVIIFALFVKSHLHSFSLSFIISSTFKLQKSLLRYISYFFHLFLLSLLSFFHKVLFILWHYRHAVILWYRNCIWGWCAHKDIAILESGITFLAYILCLAYWNE